MNSDVPRSEKAPKTADENARQDLSSGAASPNSYYQLLLQKCRSGKSILPQVAGNTKRYHQGR